jgi:hypothetical protein
MPEKVKGILSQHSNSEFKNPPGYLENITWGRPAALSRAAAFLPGNKGFGKEDARD